jgi:hypothetical protein
MRDSRAIQTVACCAILGSVVAIYCWTGGGFGPGIDPTPHEATGLVMAQQALSLLKPGGNLIVITRDTTAFKNPASDIQLARFQREISKTKATISSVHGLQVDPLRPVEVPAGDFFELLRKTSLGDVIVSFMGPPMLSEAQRSQLAGPKAAVVAFCAGALPEQVDLRSLFEAGLLQAAVVSKRTGPPPGPKPSGLRECFDRSFSLLTASNLAMLANPAQ